MPLGHGSKIVTDGLVFYYDMANTKTSWLGEPTVNLHSESSFNVLNDGLTTTEVNGQGKTWHRSVTGITGNPYNTVNIPAEEGEVYTFSIYIRKKSTLGNPSSYINRYMRSPGAANVGTRVYDNGDLSFDWKRYELQYTVPSGATSIERASLQFFNFQPTDILEISDWQVEKKSYPTPFVFGERENTEVLKDMTNNTAITANNLTYNADNTFEFDTGHLSFNSPIVMTNSDFTLELVGNISSFSERVGSFKNYGVGEFSNASLYFTNISVNGVTSLYNLYFGMSLPTATNFMWTFCFYHETKSHEVFINGISGGVRNDISAQIEDSVEFSFSEFGRSLSDRFYKGKAHQVKIYNRALSTNEVKQNFNAVRNRYGL